MDETGGGGGGEYQAFPSKLFLSHSAEISVGESFTVALISGIEKVWLKGGSIKIFHRKFFVLQCRNFRRESFTVALISGVEKVWLKKGEYQGFPSKIFCLTVPKKFPKEPFSVSLIRVSKTVKDKSWKNLKFDTRGIRNPNLPLENLVVLTPLLSFIFE